MPLLENDVIFAYLNEYDPNHNIAERIFQKLQNGEIDVEISSVSLIEMELIYRSEKMEDKLLIYHSSIPLCRNCIKPR